MEKRNKGKKPTEISAAKVAANRKNAQLSTGPRTAEGKLRVRENSFRHGMTAKRVIVPEYEDRKEFEILLSELYEYFQPHGMMEARLVDEIAACFWRLDRAKTAEAGEIYRRRKEFLNPETSPWDPSEGPRFLMLGSFASDPKVQAEEDAREEALLVDEIESLKAQRLASPQIAAMTIPDPDNINHILRYEAAAHRQLNQLLNQLERLQRRRTGETIPAPVTLDVNLK